MVLPRLSNFKQTNGGGAWSVKLGQSGTVEILNEFFLLFADFFFSIFTQSTN